MGSHDVIESMMEDTMLKISAPESHPIRAPLASGRKETGRRRRIWPLLALGLAAGNARAVPGDQLWRFYADFGVTVVEPIADLSGNGGKDVLVGSEDDSLYLVEGKGPKAGNQLWAVKFLSTLSVAVSVSDLDGDGKPDAVGGDQQGVIKAVSGASGALLWGYLTDTPGTILSLAALPDVDNDGVPDVAAGSENDTVFCLSGKPGSKLGKVVWQFGVPAGKIHGPPGGVGNPAGKTSAVSAKDAPPSGANGLALLSQKNGAFGLAVGTNTDTVFCLALAGGTVKWKSGLPGDVWKVAAFPDQDGDGIEEVLAACGADMAYLLKGSTGEVIWSHAVSMGATALAVSDDMDGDGKPDALIGDGGGQVHCVPGKAQGANVPASWTYNFGDTSTILSIAPMGDVDKDGRADCAVGTSSDVAALISGKGTKSWSLNMGGEVTAVADIGDVDGNGTFDMAAGTTMGFVSALYGGGPASVMLHAPAGSAPGRTRLGWNAAASRMEIRTGGKADEYDTGGRRLMRHTHLPAGQRATSK